MHLRIEIVYDANPEAVVHQGVYKMRAYKSRPADDDNALTLSLFHALGLQFVLPCDISGIVKRLSGSTLTRLIVPLGQIIRTTTELLEPHPNLQSPLMVTSSPSFGTGRAMEFAI